jgi:site-specific recombinase XerD
MISKEWADDFCTNVLSDILGRRINPHLFKASAITYLLEKGKDIKTVSKFVAQHNDISTTQSFYDLRKDEGVDELFD